MSVVACAVMAACALGGCPSVDLGDSPPDIGLCNPVRGEAYFESDVWPNYLSTNTANPSKACITAGCHDLTGVSPLRFTTNPVDFETNYKATQVYLNCGTPDASELLTKPLAGVEPHSGGDIFASTDDPAVQTFLMWFEP